MWRPGCWSVCGSPNDRTGSKYCILVLDLLGLLGIFSSSVSTLPMLSGVQIFRASTLLAAYFKYKMMCVCSDWNGDLPTLENAPWQAVLHVDKSLLQLLSAAPPIEVYLQEAVDQGFVLASNPDDASPTFLFVRNTRRVNVNAETLKSSDA